MVVMLAPDSVPIGTEQDRIALPLTWTVQAPHWAMPQPNFVPVNPTASRSAQSRGVSGSRSILCCVPLTVSVIIGLSSVGCRTLRVAALQCGRGDQFTDSIGEANHGSVNSATAGLMADPVFVALHNSAGAAKILCGSRVSILGGGRQRLQRLRLR